MKSQRNTKPARARLRVVCVLASGLLVFRGAARRGLDLCGHRCDQFPAFTGSTQQIQCYARANRSFDLPLRRDFSRPVLAHPAAEGTLKGHSRIRLAQFSVMLPRNGPPGSELGEHRSHRHDAPKRIRRRRFHALSAAGNRGEEDTTDEGRLGRKAGLPRRRQCSYAARVDHPPWPSRFQGQKAGAARERAIMGHTLVAHTLRSPTPNTVGTPAEAHTLGTHSRLPLEAHTCACTRRTLRSTLGPH